MPSANSYNYSRDAPSSQQAPGRLPGIGDLLAYRPEQDDLRSGHARGDSHDYPPKADHSSRSPYDSRTPQRPYGPQSIPTPPAEHKYHDRPPYDSRHQPSMHSAPHRSQGPPPAAWPDSRTGTSGPSYDYPGSLPPSNSSYSSSGRGSTGGSTLPPPPPYHDSHRAGPYGGPNPPVSGYADSAAYPNTYQPRQSPTFPPGGYGSHAQYPHQPGPEQRSPYPSGPVDPYARDHGAAMSSYDSMDERPSRRRRGNLPKWATDLLKNWFYDHIAHPYPTEQEKQELCKITGLGMTQLSNWFINARRRQNPLVHSQGQAESMMRGDSQQTNGGSDT